MPSFAWPCRLAICLMLALMLAAPCPVAARAARKAAPEPAEPATMLLANKGRQDLVAIRIISNETTSFARMDLAPGEEDEVENPGGTADICLDLGLSLSFWKKVQITGIKSLTLCGDHEACLAVQDMNDKVEHLKGTVRSLMITPGQLPACSLEGFRTGMTMKDACGLLKDYDVMEDDIYLAPMGYANIIWSARLYANRENAASLEDAVLESVELRQTLTPETLEAVLQTLEREHYVPWQATFPGIELTFTDMHGYAEKDRLAILRLCMEAFLHQSRGNCTIQFVPGSLMETLTGMEMPRGDTQIYSLTLHEEAQTLTLDMSAYSFEELQLQ